MDAIITYVDGLDPIWQKEYEKCTNVPVLDKRFRDWGTLKYLLRGIEVNMPFIHNVYLVVSHSSQVPSWADTTNLKVVLHKDIIPQEFLPTFNSTTIEMFLHKIPGLDEQFIYFNDDMFPVMPCKESDFYRDGKIIFGFTPHFFALDMFKKQCRNSDFLAKKALNRSKGLCFVRPQHICSPLLKSECEAVFEKAKKEIWQSISPLRENRNLNQYLFADYLYYQGKVINRRQPKKHFSMAFTSAQRIKSFLMHPTRKMVCINDVQLSKEKHNEMYEAIHSGFETLLPAKSRFEA